MITLLEIADLLADILETESVTAGCIDAALDYTIGIYQRESVVVRECIGCDSSFQIKKLRILVRWGNNPSAAESKAFEIAEIVGSFRDMKTKDHIIKFTEIKAVRSLGKDEKGICEFIADADLVYTKKEE